MAERGKVTDTKVLLKVSGVSKTYASSERNVLDAISLTINSGDKLGIVGETGAGKSSLLRIMAGLESPDDGTVKYKDERIKGPEEKLIAGHDLIAYLRQDYKLPKFKSVEDFLYDPYEITEAEIYKIYEACKIELLLERDTQQLSGGEKQRVALAKHIINRPKILLLDEPFSNLDHHNKRLIKDTVAHLKSELDLSIVLVTHDSKDVLPWADQIIVLKEGNIIQHSTPKEVYNKPVNEYLAGLFGNYNLIPKEWVSSNTEKFSEINGELIIRPEQITIVDEVGRDMFSGVVKSVDFMGNYYELEVSLDRQLLIVQTQKSVFKKGNKVLLSFKQTN